MFASNTSFFYGLTLTVHSLDSHFISLDSHFIVLLRVFQNPGVCGQAFPSLPYPTPFLPPFCSCPIFRASRMRKTNARGPNFVLFVRERLLCRLDFWRISCKTHVTLTVFSPTSFPGSVDVLSPPKSIDGPLANCWGLGSSLRWPSTPSHSTREGRGG